MKDMKRIIYKRFGSLTDHRHVIRSFAEVGRLLRVHFDTVRKVVNRFLERGAVVENLVNKRDKFTMLSADLREKLLSKPLLLKWAPYSLLERAHIIKGEWDVKISTFTLHRFYRESGVAYTTAKAVYRKALATKPELDERRLKIAALLATMVTNNTPLIYMDESR